MTDQKQPAKKAQPPVQPQETAPAASEAEDKLASGEKLTELEAAQLQFPAKAGYENVEIAARSQDVDEKAAARHEKVFVVPKHRDVKVGDYGDSIFNAVHTANIDAMRQQAINQGLRPQSDGQFVGAEAVKRDDGSEDPDSVGLRYAVDVVPVSIATPEEQRVRVTVDDQHDQDKRGDTSVKTAAKADLENKPRAPKPGSNADKNSTSEKRENA